MTLADLLHDLGGLIVDGATVIVALAVVVIAVTWLHDQVIAGWFTHRRRPRVTRHPQHSNVRVLPPPRRPAA